MRSKIAILLASLFLVQSMSRTFILVHYQANKEYIANVLCENKTKKELQCEGKCHLKKELQKEDKKENSTSGNSKEKMEMNLFNIQPEENTAVAETKLAAIFHYTAIKTDRIITPVFHPPGLNA